MAQFGWGWGGRNPKNVQWNEVVKAVVERKEDGRKEILGARDEVTKDRCTEVYKEKRKVKRCIYKSKKEVNEQFGRKMNHDTDLFWKEVSKVKGEKWRIAAE